MVTMGAHPVPSPPAPERLPTVRSLVVTTWFPDDQTPSRTPFIVEHCRALQEQGHDLAVVHIRIGEVDALDRQEVYKGIPVTRVALAPRDPRSYASVARVIRAGLRGTDVLHTMAFSSILFAAGPWMTRRVPWIHTEHWSGVMNPASVGPTWQRLAWMRYALRFPHIVTGVTQQLCGEMSEFVRPGATRVVPCVVENPGPPTNFPSSPPLRLVGVGALIEGKRPGLALETIAELRRRDVDVKYTLVGGGPLQETLEDLARSLNIDDRVVLTGAIPPDEVPHHLAQAHVFFLPSAQENFFTAVAEAIAAGRPAAVPLSGGFDDYCTDENSVLSNSWEDPALADAVQDAWARFRDTDPEVIAATVRSRFSRAAIGAQFTRLYRSLTDQPFRATETR